MSTTLPTLSYDDYTVGIICASRRKAMAVEMTLDESHGRAQGTTGDNDAGFSFGRIGEHNVVIGYPTKRMMVTGRAATMAKDMMRSFPIKIGLMVGIGSGVWSEQNNIRLGDVVVSGSDREHGGVVQWEHDRNGVFQNTGTLNKPPRSVLDAIRSRELDANFGATELRRSLLHEEDELFEANYEHVGGDECANCDRSRLVRNRPHRTNARVHYGTIASSNTVVKDGSTRDRIARDEGIICFETDAAGLMPTFPCLVIRGICDYADSHRNPSKLWQFYAVTMAAAYAKVLLQSIPSADLAAERLASEVSEMQIDNIPREEFSFFGRRAELEFLERRIITAQDCQKFAVFGSGGMGKTALVRSFAQSVADQHPDIAVFWLRVQSAEAFESDAAEVVRQLNLRTAAKVSGDVKDLVRRHFSAPSAGKWLLIVEDVDDAETMDPSTRSIGLLRHLPESPLGATIFTTHSPSVAHRLAGRDVLELKGLTGDAAAELLERWISDRELLKDPVANAKFLAELGNVPSAIIEAAASINNPKLSISDFSRIVQSRGLATTSALDNRDQRVQRRHRRAPVPYAYPAADTSTVQHTFDGIDSSQISSAPDGPLPSSPGASKPTRLQCIKPCYFMVVLGFLAIGGSLAVGLYYSIAQDRMGDGFTTAGWMVAVSTLILAAPMAKHYPNCRCWDTHQYAVL